MHTDIYTDIPIHIHKHIHIFYMIFCQISKYMFYFRNPLPQLVCQWFTTAISHCLSLQISAAYCPICTTALQLFLSHIFVCLSPSWMLKPLWLNASLTTSFHPFPFLVFSSISHFLLLIYIFFSSFSLPPFFQRHQTTSALLSLPSPETYAGFHTFFTLSNHLIFVMVLKHFITGNSSIFLDLAFRVQALKPY